MKCNYCGYDIPNGIMICQRCGREVQMVPDYNPFDSYLAENVKQSFDNAKYETGRSNLNNTQSRVNYGNTSSGSRQTSTRTRSGLSQEELLRRKRTRRQKELKKKKRKRFTMLFIGILVLVVVLSIVGYLNSYSGIVKRGYSALSQKDYTKAESLFKRAINKSKSKVAAYEGMSDLYILEGNMDAAESVYLDAIEQQKTNVKLYSTCCKFYMDSEQPLKIPVLLADLDDNMLEKLSEYTVSKPTFSLDNTEVYDDVQQLTIETTEAKIYYTIDDTDPTFNSQQYSEPIQIGEGTTTVMAFAVNSEGVPSATVTKSYEVEFPIEDAPAVSPSTGQYDSSQSIEIKVPEGYTAYYTLDGSDPTTSSSVYKKPIEMPDGETLFKAILVNAKGRSSGITTRNYVKD